MQSPNARLLPALSRRQRKLWKDLKQGRAAVTFPSLGDNTKGEGWRGENLEAAGRPGRSCCITSQPQRSGLGKVKEFLEPSWQD